jgi:uncharacterized glyoxalase superfamily protein PhnB
MNLTVQFKNPYRPGAGHFPPFLAGRETEFKEFDRLLDQDEILENMVLTGLRGVGKTVLLEAFKPHAVVRGWVWVGADLSESASITEENLALRLITDLSVATASLSIEVPRPSPGFGRQEETESVPMNFENLAATYKQTPGLVTDKLKRVLETAWTALAVAGSGKVIFAYDEAQNLADHADKDQFPLSLLLDVFQSLQRKGVPFMLVLTGLPTLFPKLVEARTFAERMFRVVTVDRLSDDEQRQAIQKPIEVADCPVRFDDNSVGMIGKQSAGYPYFIQFICREVFDVFIQQLSTGGVSSVPVDAIQRKLDTDFFAGRWARVTDRQRQLLWVIARLERPDHEFTIQEMVERGKELLAKPFSSSHTNRILVALSDQGLIYKNRFGRYSFAVPLLGDFILRTYEPPTDSLRLS